MHYGTGIVWTWAIRTSKWDAGGSHSTVVVCWTAGQQVKQWILHLRHNSYQNYLVSSGCPCLEYSLTVLQCRIMAWNISCLIMSGRFEVSDKGCVNISEFVYCTSKRWLQCMVMGTTSTERLLFGYESHPCQKFYKLISAGCWCMCSGQFVTCSIKGGKIKAGHHQ